jgi:tetratricopeptide (TPR) repeat protein
VARAAADRLVELDADTHASPLTAAIRERLGRSFVPGVTEAPDSPLGRIRLRTRRAEWALEAGDDAAGLAEVRPALALYEQALQVDITPSLLAYAHELYRVASRCFAVAGEADEAVRYAEIALADVLQGCLDAPCGEVAVATAGLATRLVHAGELTRAAELTELAYGQWERMPAEPDWYPEAESQRRAEQGRDLHVLNQMSDVWLLRLLLSTPGEHALALDDFVFWDYPSTETSLRGAASTSVNLVSINLEVGREGEALPLAERAVELGRLLVEADRDRNVDVLGSGVLVLAEVLERLGEDPREPAAEAAGLYEEAVRRSGGRFRDRYEAAARLSERSPDGDDPLARSRRILVDHEDGRAAVGPAELDLLGQISGGLLEAARDAEGSGQLPLEVLDLAVRAALVVRRHEPRRVDLLAAGLNLRSRVLARLGRVDEAVRDCGRSRSTRQTGHPLLSK